jgi:serine/threonine protein kinase
MKRDSLYTCPFCGRQHSRILDRCPESRRTVPEVYRFDGITIGGKYQLDRRIAEGGMGVVYAGTHLSIGRKIAVKFLHSSIAADEDLVARFQNEARLAASIGHRNIVDIIDMGSYRGRLHYIVMEYLEGKDLDATLAEEISLPVMEATDLIIQILGGLKAAHRKGIVHRDLKPENVFLVSQPDGERYVKILDFGVSKLLAGFQVKDVKLTQTGMVFGTPRYMAPEQARGGAGVDHRADLYSVGAIYYEMLCGIPMFTSESYNELIVDVMTQDPVPIIERNPTVPEDLSAKVMKAVSKDPSGRFGSASEFIEAVAAHSSSPVFTRTQSGEIVFSEAGLTISTGQVLDPGDRTPGPARKPAEPTPPGEPGLVLREVPGEIRHAVETFSRMPTLLPGQMAEPSDSLLPLEISDASLTPAPWSLRQSLPPQTIENSQVHIIVRKRSPAMVILSSLAVVIVVAASLWAGVVYYHAVKAEDAGEPAVAAAPAAPVRVAPVSVTIANLPEGAEVYVDGVLHPERPLSVEPSGTPRRIRVTKGDDVLMDESVAVLKDSSLFLQPEGHDQQEEGAVAVTKASKKKPKGAKETKKKRSIDQEYPM